MNNKKLVIIAPCYNEEEIIEYSIAQLSKLLNLLISENLISDNSQICYINDGSTDNTRLIIEKHCAKNNHIALINFTRNFSQQYALLAGLNEICADMIISIDSDLQDDLSVIKEMILKYNEGYEIVFGCRKKRKIDSFIKKNTARMFYSFMNFIDIKIRPNHSEFRLLNNNAINKLKAYKEKTIFLRGIVQSLGLKTCNVYYDGQERIAGKTKYSLFKLFGLAWNAITCFSILPLRLITIVGVITSFISVLIIVYGIVSYFKHYAIPGWTSIIMTISFFSGIIIMSLGIIGEYLSKVLIEVKDRPLYQIEKVINL